MTTSAVRVLPLLAGCALGLVVGCGEVGVPTPYSTPFPPSPRPTMEASREATETARPSATPEAAPTPTVEPTAPPTFPPTTSAEVVVVQETTLSILSYVYSPYLEEALDETAGVPYLWLDRAAYGQPAPETAVLRPFKAVILENRYLRLTILPELGGRLYQCVFKPTGQSVFYQNRVLKPTQWGPLSRERNWWLAAGGIEWAFPVDEHGYEWGIPWGYSIERSGAEVKVVVWDTEEPRLRARVEIALHPDCAYFTVRLQAQNPTDSSASVQFWTNAMLTLGSSPLSPNTEFVYPTSEILIHSAGPNGGLEEEGSTAAWPLWQGRDLSRYENWEDWLGFFAPRLGREFVGAYNHDTDLGVVRSFSRGEAPGVKLFAWGLDSPFVAEYADDGSQYFEMWGGPNLTFWPEDDIVLEPGEGITWTEYWYPFVGIAGLDFANREAAINLRYAGNALQVGLATSSSREGVVVLHRGEQEIHREQITVSPESPYLGSVPVAAEVSAGDTISCSFLTLAGDVVASYQVSPSGMER